MKIDLAINKWIISLSLAILGALSLPLTAQVSNYQTKQATTDDVSAILSLIRGYGAVGDVVIINNYAIVNYFFGQNGDNVTLARQNGRWRIVSGRQITSCARGSCQTDSCSINADCLVQKGVPRNIATQLLNRIDSSTWHQSQQRELQNFRQAWRSKNRNIAPFLGYWHNQNWPSTAEITVSIWPSHRPNIVCMIGISETSQYVSIGRVSGNKINTPNGSFSIDDAGGYDAITSNASNPYQQKWLISLGPLNTWYFNRETRRKLQEAGCTNSLSRE